MLILWASLPLRRSLLHFQAQVHSLANQTGTLSLRRKQDRFLTIEHTTQRYAASLVRQARVSAMSRKSNDHWLPEKADEELKNGHLKQARSQRHELQQLRL